MATLPGEWSIKKLGTFARYAKGKKPIRQQTTPNDLFRHPYIDIKAFEQGIVESYTDGEKCVFCSEKDFLMVWDGSRSGYVGKGVNGALGSTLMKINFPGMSNSYAYYFLQSKFLEINKRAKGSGTPHVDPHLLWNYDFPIVSLSEQQKIVEIIEELFSELDKGVESLKKAKEQLKVYRQSVLKNAFEKLPKIPFSDMILSSQNGVSKRKGDSGYDFKVLRLADINNLKINDISARKIQLTEDEIEKYKINKSDLICIRVNGSRDLVGRLIFVTEYDDKSNWAFCDHFIRFVINKIAHNSKFIHYYFMTEQVRKYVQLNMVSSAGQNTVSQVTIKSIMVPTCSMQEQERIVQNIESKFSVCDEMEKTVEESLKKAEKLRQSILKKAFEGKLTEKWREENPELITGENSAEALLRKISCPRMNTE